MDGRTCNIMSFHLVLVLYNRQANSSTDNGATRAQEQRNKSAITANVIIEAMLSCNEKPSALCQWVSLSFAISLSYFVVCIQKTPSPVSIYHYWLFSPSHFLPGGVYLLPLSMLLCVCVCVCTFSMFFGNQQEKENPYSVKVIAIAIPVDQR